MEAKHFLFFPPGAHPTYVPLGLASLAGYARQQAPQVSLEVADLNIRFWKHVLERNAHSALLQGFFQGRVGDFYRPELYSQYKGQLDSHYRYIQGVEQDLQRSWKAGNFAAVPELDALIEFLVPTSAEPVRVAFSVMYPGQLLFALYLSRRIRELRPDAEVVLGGAAMSAIVVEELRRAAPWVDAIIQGEGEIPFIEWLLGRSPLCPAQSLDLEMLPDPDFSFANFSDYLFPETVLPVIFSRGCQWKRCKFCCHNASFRGYRTTTYQDFAGRLQRLQQRYGARFFYLADQYVSARDLDGISRAILDAGVHVRFHVMGRPSADYTPEILQLAKQAGCRWISWGVESFSAQLLTMCDKGTTPEEISNVLEQSGRAGISNLAMMIFGLPGSTEACLQETLDWATRLHPMVDAFTSSQFQLFGGTPFYRNRQKLGLEILGQEVLLQVGPHPVQSLRFAFQAQARSFAQNQELAIWERWKLFTRGGPSFYEILLCEHYLLHCTHARDFKQTPHEPIFPPCVAA